MTPAEVRAVIEAKVEQRDQEWKFQDVLNGVRCSLLANINRSQDTQPFTAADFSILKQAEDEMKEPQSPEESMKIMDQWVIATGGSIV